MWRTEKTAAGQDLIWDGVEQGIAPSPTKGTANIQNANISTELGEVMCSYGRAKQTQTAITNGTLTASVSDGTSLLASSSPLLAGQWINISSTDIPYTPPTSSVSYLVVAGGGAGGGTVNTQIQGGGGGGAGGMKTGSATISVASYTITVGNGGTAASGAVGGNGQDSSFGALATSTGGGGGGLGHSGTAGANGGSGGGAGDGSTPGTGVVGQGKDGGTSVGNAERGGGGGGASAAGANASGTTGGNGGAGTASSISGASVTYAGGGGGGGATKGTGGAGGGGNGESPGVSAAVAGTANTGGGGGGAADNGVSAPKAGANGGSGVVVISYPTGQITATGGTITTSGGNTIHTFNSGGTFQVTAITDITMPTGVYYVSYQDTNGKIKLSNYFDPTASSVFLHGTSGTATFSTTPNWGSPIAKATERYNDGTTEQYRYYILDSNALVWVYDTSLYASSLASSGVGMTWFLPDKSTSYYTGTAPSGMAILNGFLLVFAGEYIYCKATVNLGNTIANTTTYRAMRNTLGAASDNAQMASIPSSTNPHFALVGHQGRCYYTDGTYVGEIFPNTSVLSGTANIQSYGQYTASTSTATITKLLSGSVPADFSGTRIPAVFFTDSAGTQPTNLTADTIYWIGDYTQGAFRVYAASTGGAAINIQTGAAGNQYFNTFYPVGDDASPGATHATTVFTPERVDLPTFEVAQSLVEIGNYVLIGCYGNVVYPWNQTDALPSGIISLPEAGAKTMITVNQMAYIFAGNKGNIYITDGSTASLVLKVPDYCAGIAGTANSYIEPVFTWGDAMYLRGRVYFSILDQTSTKTGNCGGVWSFTPTQNFYVGQDIGMALRLQNQNSYGTYNGLATVLIPSAAQGVIAPQYWAGWYSSITSPTYGVDFTSSVPVTSAAIETDALPTGTFLANRTFQQVEYKVTTPLATGDSIQLYYRVNLTDAYTSCGTLIEETAHRISGYFDVNFQNTQWIQFQARLTSTGDATSSFVRLKEIRLR